MSLISCPECAKQISDQAISCPNCGFPLSKLESVIISKETVQSQNDPPKDLPIGAGNSKENCTENLENQRAVTHDSPLPEMTPNTDDYDKLIKYILGALAVVILLIIVFGYFSKQEQELQNAKIGKEKLEKAKSLITKSTVTSADWAKAKELLETVPSVAPQFTEAKSLLSQKVEPKIAEKNEEAAREEAKKARLAEESQLTTGGKRVRAKHPDWDVEDCNTIASRKIRIGMTREQVRVAWGRPYSVNKTSTAQGTSEQWVMSSGLPTSYVYFEDGICTAVQN